MLSSYEEAWEREQRSKSSTYCDIEPSRELQVIHINLQDFQEIRTDSTTLRNYCSGEFIFFPSEGKMAIDYLHQLEY